MDLLAPARAFDRYQQRRRGLAVAAAVVKKFGDDRASSLAALVAYYGFFSLYPLLLVMTTVLGFILRDNAAAQKSVENSVLAQFPIIGSEISVHALTGSAAALTIGLITSLLAGLGVTRAAEHAFDEIWGVTDQARPGFLASQLRGLCLLVALGLLFLVSTAASGLVSAGFGGAAAKVAGYAIAVLVNLALFFASFRLMTAPAVATRDLRVGVVAAALGWTVLQAVGGYYIGHVYRSQSEIGAQFGLVIALLVWMHLGAQMTLYAAEINVVLTRKLWPRSLFGDGAKPQPAAAAQDAAAQDAAAHDRTAHDATAAHDRTAHDATAAHDGTAQDGTARDATAQTGTG